MQQSQEKCEAGESRSMPTLNLPTAEGRIAAYSTRPPRAFPAAAGAFNRIAYAAAHVVADPLADYDPWVAPAIDWERTVAFRRYLWSLGLGVAEAMDTAQRGMGLDWPTSLDLIRHSLAAAKDVPGALIGCGAGTDHLEAGPDVTIDEVIRAYEEQCAAVEKLGGRIVLMASRALARLPVRPTITRRSTVGFLRRCASRSSSIGSAKCSTPRSKAIGAAPITTRPWRSRSMSSPPTRRRLTA
jgi:hypothetical protein